MHALLVVSHPVHTSLTHSVATAIAQGIAGANPENTFEIADLAQEGFNPVFSVSDMAAFQRTGVTPADVVAEQLRIDHADALVLVFPIYWWSMPGLLKGWIDRVFSNGWAYEETADGNVIKKLGHLPVHLVALGAANQRTFEKRGYADAFHAQIDHGIFDYCGASVLTSEMLLMPELGTPEACIDAARHIGGRIFQSSLF
ncbi:NAD(P)H-dependent oxidoreductase [Pectobacterium brasiliense]|uniref:NAD(P)H-dependent oxidoreductase n=1 Tax=Pectobacterium TaxID=122277 RepID=UPI00027E0D8C|nr:MULTISPECIES: NAD(P)H-dependent oxidoreductase [Pectobacterium]GKV97634.1 NAD(P)H dehydrogenase (quinone) [Pectobacterium carotovorum subsp. carotovorum]AFR02270.1 NAD(P)H dehydrogenase (quinone) [Pectobacterium carotovorum subsp. carotovorum PCC21]KHS72110.1 NAD(P)H dehydrogenase [Pectobacterium brasiliense]KHS78632.1 NAD(P)H dehydrogenase [Pectobacterium brasiliense]KHT17199.1 NAD(P)H dehydrogenase [Pectobacterium brasiliense]